MRTVFDRLQAVDQKLIRTKCDFFSNTGYMT